MDQSSEDKRPRKKAKRTHTKQDDLVSEQADGMDVEDEGVAMDGAEEMVTEDIHGVTSEIEKEVKDQQERYKQYVEQCKQDDQTEPLVCDLCKCKMNLDQRLQNGMHFCRRAIFLSIEKKHFTKTKSVNIPTLMTNTATGALVFRCPLCADWHPITDACALTDV